MISGKMYGRLCSMTKDGAINLLLASISEMESYNGQSITSAIARAAGARETDNGFVFPNQKEMNETWADQYPVID